MNTQGSIAELISGKKLLAFYHGIWSVAGFLGAFMGMSTVSYNISIFHHFLAVTCFSLICVGLVGKYLYRLPNLENTGRPFAIPEKSLLVLCFIAFFSLICESVMYDWSVIYFDRMIPNSKPYSGIGFTSFMAMMTIGRFTNNFLIGKLGLRKIILFNSTLIFTGTLISIIYPNFFIASLGFGLIGFGISSMVPMMASEASKSKKHESFDRNSFCIDYRVYRVFNWSSYNWFLERIGQYENSLFSFGRGLYFNGLFFEIRFK